MLPSLALAFIAGLLLGSQIPYFPISTSLALLVVAFAVLLSNASRWFLYAQ